MSKKQAPPPDIPEILEVAIRTPDTIVFEGQCKALLAENVIGPFGVYPGHQNFITNITGTVKVQTLEKEEMIDYFINMGILRVRMNTVNVYIMLYSPTESNAGQQTASAPSPTKK